MLELRKIKIKDIRFSEEEGIKEEILYLCRKKLEQIVLEDPRIKSVEFDTARPGESARIIPVKDIVQPRAKLSGRSAFPGIFEDNMQEAGEGITYVLEDCAVTTTGPIVGFQEGLIDMSGPGAKYSLYSRLNHLTLCIVKNSSVSHHEHEEAVRKAGLRIAEHLGRLSLSYPNYISEQYDWKAIGEGYSRYPQLPKVVYICNIMAQGLLHDSYFYGRDAKTITPLIATPTEIMDGALISGNCVSPGSKSTTYMHQNNAVIYELFKKHGKELNFVGVILDPLMITLKEKFRCRMLTVRYAKMLSADGVIISQEGFGNPTTDLMMTCEELEKIGIKTVIITNEDAGSDGMSESLPDSVPQADAIVSTGNSNETILLPKMEKTIGAPEEVEKICGGNHRSVQKDGSLLVEIHGIMGSHNLQGNTHLGAITI